MAFWSRTSDGSLINFDNVVKWFQDGSKLRAIHVNGQSTDFVFTSAAIASAALVNVATLVSATSGERALFQVLPATAHAGGANVICALLGQGFQLDLVAGVFSGSVAIGGIATTITYVNGNILILQWVTAGGGTLDVVYTDKNSNTITLSGAFVVE